MDEVTHTILPNSGSGWGGALGAGFGGLIGSWLGNGGFGGFGGAGARAGIGYDTGAINGIANQLNSVSGQIANADRDLLMQTSGQNQFMGNLINSTGDAIVNAVNAGTLAQTQNQGATNLAMCQGFGGINSAIDRGFGSLNLNVAEQGAQSRLQAQELASQQQACCCQVIRAIETEGCANRELQREIQTQALRDVLANSQAENAALKAQLFQTNAMNAQTAAIIAALKPTTTTAGG